MGPTHLPTLVIQLFPQLLQLIQHIPRTINFTVPCLFFSVFLRKVFKETHFLIL